MRTFFTLIYKDFLLLIRDKAGLAMLFIMPAALVLIMTYLQDTTFRSVNEEGIKLILLNSDKDSLGNSIEKQIERNHIFKVSKTINGQTPSPEAVSKAVAHGDFQIGIIIPEKATKTIRFNVKYNVSLAFANIQSNPDTLDSVRFSIYIDPVTKPSFRQTLLSSIREFSGRIENEIRLNEISNEINRRVAMPVTNLNFAGKGMVYYKEEYALNNGQEIIPNSTQHNVPAWTLFAIFFIVISLTGNMIKEREDGNLARLLTMPTSYSTILLSKMVVFLLVCILQFTLIVLMGMYLFPIINLPGLVIANKLILLLLVTVASSIAAIGYGIAIGTIAGSHQQASIFASISVVILAAIGGVWVPVFAMPKLMKTISCVSPMNWGLNGYYDILLRNAGIESIWHYLVLLLTFFIICLVIAIWYNRTKRALI